MNDYQERFDMGYDTDRIAEFEIDKSFTDYLLCQTCCSKLFFRFTCAYRTCKRPERVRLL